MKPYSSNSNYAERCKDFEKKKITNFEKIKQMSVEDMALMLMCPAEYDTDFNKKSKCKGSFSNCYNCTLHWLESEVEENERY